MKKLQGQTKKKRSNGELPESGQLTHHELSKAYDLSPIGVLAIDASGIITYANGMASGYCNLQKEEILGRQLFSLCEDESPGKVNEARITRLEEIIDQEFRINSGPAERCVLISSKLNPDAEAGVQTYLFIRDISKLKKRENLFSYLNQAATALAKTRDTAGALEQIAQFIVPKFADWFTIDRLKENRLELLLLKHADPGKIEWAHQYRKNYPADLNANNGPAVVLKTGKPGFVSVVTEQMIDALITDPVQRSEVNKIGLHSVIITPISAGDKISGLVNFISSEPSRHYDETDVEFAQNFASLIGLVLENARLNENSAREIVLRKRGEEQFRFLTDAIPHKVWTSGADGRATHYNQQWHDYTGVKGFEALRDKIWDFIHPDDRAVAAVEWPAAVERGEPMEMEHRLRRHDGAYRWHLSRFSANKNNDGQAVLWVGTSTDIHEQKAARIELAATNEEVAAVNEELSAANEELSAANEELVAVNEEVAATNEELAETQRSLEQSNAELAERESRLRMAIDSTNLGTWDYNPLSRDLYWSEECKAIFGLPSDAAIKFESFASRVHPDDRVRAGREFKESIASETSGRYDITYRILRFDNEDTRWVRIQGTVLFDTNGLASRYLGTVLDITENKLARESIERSEKLFRSIILNIPKSLIIVIDRNHRYVTIEGDIMEKMGYDRRDYEGKHPAEISPERYEATRGLYERVIAGEKFSVERKTENGDNYIVHLVPLKNADNEVDAGLIIALDITDIKQAEERSAKLAAIVESSDDAIVSKSFDSVITSWNYAAERMFGYTEEEMIGQTIYKIIPPDRHDEEGRILALLREGKSVEHFETKRVTKDGRLVDVSLTISPVKDAQGNVIGISKIARDITEKKQEEQRKNDFIGMVSHELKTPLTSLTGIIQVTNARLKNSEDPFLAGAMERANIQVKRMTGMINGFLNISRLEAGKMSLELQVFDLGELLRETADETKLIVNTHPLILTVSGRVNVNADRDKISSVVSNLLSNAVKYSPKGSSIELACEVTGDIVTVSAKDEGIGIKPEDIEKIFERYYRIETDYSRHISGFGIGLYLSAEIIQRHNGKIWVESEFGKGSTFYFTLPVVEN